MLHRIVRGIGHRGVRNLVEVKTGAVVGDAAGDHAVGANVFELDIFGGIELASVFDGVVEQFAQGDGDFHAFRFGQHGNFLQKLQQAVGGFEIAARLEAEPFGSGGNDFDAVVPAGTFVDAANHFGEGDGRKGRGEITESVFAHGVDDVLRSAVRGEDEQTAVRADAANFAQQQNIFVAGVAFAGDDQVVGAGGDEFERGGVGRRALDDPGFGIEDAGEQGVDGGVAFDVQRGFLRCGRGVVGGRGSHGHGRGLPETRMVPDARASALRLDEGTGATGFSASFCAKRRISSSNGLPA